MPSMWCFHSSRSASPPLPNNRPVGLPRPVGVRAHVLGLLTARNTSKGSETRDASTTNDNLQAITQAFASSLTMNAPPVRTSQNPTLIDVPHPVGRRSRIFTQLTTRKTSKGSQHIHADVTPVETSQNTNSVDVPHPAERRSRIFTRLTNRKTSKCSQNIHADATPVETFQNANSVDVPHPAERRSRIFTRLTTRSISNGSEDLQAEATSVETSHKTNLVDVPHPVKRRSRFFTHLTTRNTSQRSEDLPAEAAPVETSQTTKPVNKSHSAERRSRIFTRLTTRKTSKYSGDIQAEATPIETSQNPNGPHPVEHRSLISTHLTTQNTLNDSEHVQAEAIPIETPQNQTMSIISEDIVQLDNTSEVTPPSIHLYDMQISQRLRSGSLLSSSSSLHLPPPPSPAPPTTPTSSSPPEGVWAHFPSHNRRERSLSPAGGREGVVVRDFAPVVGGSPARAMKKPRSMGDMFRGWARRQERQMTKPPGGHRSSIAPGGLVEFPELELVAPAPPLTTAPAPQPDLSAPSAEVYAAQFADCVDEYPLGDGEADLLRGLYLAEQVALRREVNNILAEEMALGLYEGDFI